MKRPPILRKQRTYYEAGKRFILDIQLDSVSYGWEWSIYLRKRRVGCSTEAFMNKTDCLRNLSLILGLDLLPLKHRFLPQKRLRIYRIKPGTFSLKD